MSTPRCALLFPAVVLLLAWPQPARAQPFPAEPVDMPVEAGSIFEGLKRAAGPSGSGLHLSVITDSTPLLGHDGRRVYVSEGVLIPAGRGAAWLAGGGAERGGGRSAASVRGDVVRLLLAREVAVATGAAGSAAEVDARAVKLFERSGGDARPTEVRRLLRVLLEFPIPEHQASAYTNRLMDRFGFWDAVRRGETLDPSVRSDDRFAAARRPDGTIDWRRATARGTVEEARGLLHFGLALFLKEVVLVAQTGDPSRIDEFFHGLTQTDFYVHYGMFALGAHAGDVAFTRYLQRFVKPGFVSGLMRTNLVLASGLLLPGLVSGQGSPKQLAISLAALGLSSAAVQAGMAPIRWAMTIDTAAERGFLAMNGFSPRWVKLGGWFYTVAETAVVLYLADRIGEAMERAADDRAARDALGAAGMEFVDAATREDATPENVRAALGELHEAFGDYREHLVAPARTAEAEFARKLERLARDAKRADEVRRARALAEDYPALGDWVRRNYDGRGERTGSSPDGFERRLRNALETLHSGQADAISRAYASTSGRGTGARPYLGDAPRLEEGVGSGGGFLGDVRRGFARFRLRASLRGASSNRLETYDDEARLLEATAALLRARGRDDLAAELARGEDLARLRDQEAALFRGAGFAPSGGGAIDALRGAADGR